MGSRRLTDDDRDGAFELPDSHFEAHKPGFKAAAKGSRKSGSEGEHRFPRMAAEKDVPQTPLAKRIARRTRT